MPDEVWYLSQDKVLTLGSEESKRELRRVAVEWLISFLVVVAIIGGIFLILWLNDLAKGYLIPGICLVIVGTIILYLLTSSVYLIIYES